MSRLDLTQPPSLAAERLSLSYGGTTIVAGLDLAVPERAFTALLGPNGSGKSTVLRALAGLLAPKSGAVLLDGRSIADRPAKETARRIGILSQGPAAPEGLTVLDLIRQGRYPHRSLFGRWSQADEDACAQALRLTGTGALCDRPLDSLSGGQRQRAWIAMALAQETDILLLDEPTTFLDLTHQIELMDLIASLVDERGTTVVAVLHDLNQAARYADHMVFLKAGKIAATGEPGQVITAQVVEQVFGVATSIVPDPVTGTPMCIPRAKGRRAGRLRGDTEGNRA
ncbi:ABC transporter ATP-binding protein [Bosea sp. (in: a-proteobacteria)]|jgi:iron complex transport system ATP-binding protein|uniref:ABC transporter ATP-binding protein n=1 Tax=Bosea sp. (in: a-proteobacteria) TaxID=1871050 RepID=UPI002DDD1AFC|nr:ABC transporter ATP-binding protein [Bosea sp. (in: a-proteobacteria)]HEV2510786.1 ABC transporter ATP-binding protein [Bosea sp. (in: a-proteobacteria)]